MRLNNIKTELKKWISVFVLLSVIVVAVPVHASSKIDLDAKAELTINYEIGEAEFALYHVGDTDADAVFTATDDFAKYPVKMNDLDTEGWKLLGETLAAYVSRDGIVPTKQGITDDDGYLFWDNLTPGLYLVVGTPAIDENHVKYTPSPSLISLPNRTDDWTWNYSPVLNPKFVAKPLDDLIPDYVKRKVLKVWDDNNAKENRPESILVQLLEDGEIYDTVVLNADNNWQYIWERLPAASEWSVVEEEVPEGYTVTATLEKQTFVITNSAEQPRTPADDYMIPQTGQLWWPIPILAMTGLVCLLVGWVRRKTLGDINEK